MALSLSKEAGKGDRRRATQDDSAYRNNYDAIFGKKDKPAVETEVEAEVTSEEQDSTIAEYASKYGAIVQQEINSYSNGLPKVTTKVHYPQVKGVQVSSGLAEMGFTTEQVLQISNAAVNFHLLQGVQDKAAWQELSEAEVLESARHWSNRSFVAASERFLLDFSSAISSELQRKNNTAPSKT